MHRYLAIPPTLALLLVGAARVLAVPTVTATVPIGQRPVAVAVDPGDHRVYVADVGMGAVIPVDGARGTVEAPISVGGQPVSLAIDTAGRRLFVGNRDGVSASVTVIDTASDRPRVFLPAGRRVRGLAFDPEVNQLYVGDADAGELLIMDGASGQVLDQIRLGGTPTSIAVNEQNGEVAVVVQGSAPALAVLDPSNRGATPVMVPVNEGQPMQVDVDSRTGKFFVTTNGADPSLLVLRPGSSQFDNAIPIAPGATGLAIDSRTSRIYVAHTGASQATVIDGATGTQVAVVPLDSDRSLDSGANHAAVDQGSTPTRVYMVDTGSAVLSILTDQ